MNNTKQVIVVRKDLNMRTGKIAAQCSHASMSFLTKGINLQKTTGHGIKGVKCRYISPSYNENQGNQITFWLTNSFRKICCYVNSEEELKEVHQKALNSGLISHLVEDNGATEFKGVKTLTCCAIGPAWDNSFEGVTDHLPLL
jgi:PTH2 family peptidyl-tRNA hydrolase